ncbi:hypothetical protein Tco_1079018 [Tanacetum coccineum]|uniref:Uncharacterized protein n=1 Tax=Tanacetum coccineum TaxID=301880 RepID=A0ABQ5HSP7_9ASTR
MDENPEFEMDNAVWTPSEAGTQAQGMDLVRERVDEDLGSTSGNSKSSLKLISFFFLFGNFILLNKGAGRYRQKLQSILWHCGNLNRTAISSSTYRDNAKRRSRFQQQPVKTKMKDLRYEKERARALVLNTGDTEKLVIVESQGSLRDRTGVFGCLLELSVTPPGAKAVEGKSVKIDYRVEDGISAIESLKFPPVGSSKYGFEVNFPYSIFFRYRSKDRDVPEVVSRKVSSVYAKAEEELVGNERVSHRERGGRRGSSLCCTSSWIGWIF